MKKYEIEDKYLIKELPCDYEEYPKKEIKQSYIYLSENTDIRVRQEFFNGEYKYYYNVKINMESSYAVRKELEYEISKELYDRLVVSKVEGTNEVSKTRYLYPADLVTSEIDIFHGELEGLKLVEVEFDSLFQRDFFCQPEWFGDDVTEDETYRNRNLCTSKYSNQKLIKRKSN